VVKRSCDEPDIANGCFSRPGLKRHEFSDASSRRQVESRRPTPSFKEAEKAHRGGPAAGEGRATRSTCAREPHAHARRRPRCPALPTAGRAMQSKGCHGAVQGAAGGTTDPAKMRLQIYPRRKAGQKKRESGSSTAVVVTLDVLNSFADIPLVHAAKKLGISKTALKSACRTLGLERWPFRRPPDDPSAGEASPQSDTVGKKRKKRGDSVRGVRGGATTGKIQKLAPKKRGSRKARDDSEDDQEPAAGRKRGAGARGKAREQEEEEEEEEREEELLVDGEDEKDEEEGDGEPGQREACSEHASEGSMPDIDDESEGGFVHTHEGGMDKRKQCNEVWTSDTEEGDGVGSSDGPHGLSDKTSCDGSRSSNDECCTQDSVAEREFNDLSWMSHGGGHEDFGPQHTLDDAPLLPLVIKGPPPLGHNVAPDLSAPAPPRERKPAGEHAKADASESDEEYHLHVRGDELPGLLAYARRSHRHHDYLASTAKQQHVDKMRHRVLDTPAAQDGYRSFDDFNTRLSSHHAWTAHGRSPLDDASNVEDNYDKCLSMARERGHAMERERTIREMALDSAQGLSSHVWTEAAWPSSRIRHWATASSHARLHSLPAYPS
jgi:hypothetical protein